MPLMFVCNDEIRKYFILDPYLYNISNIKDYKPEINNEVLERNMTAELTNGYDIKIIFLSPNNQQENDIEETFKLRNVEILDEEEEEEL